MNNENFDTCRRIGHELEKIASDSMYRCPECGEIIPFSNAQYSVETNLYTCQCCHDTYDADELEPYGLYDYFSDVFDVEYYSAGRGADDYRGVRIMIACGGPNIYVDTKRGQVELRWWTEYADYFLDDDVVAEIDEIFRELWAC